MTNYENILSCQSQIPTNSSQKTNVFFWNETFKDIKGRYKSICEKVTPCVKIEIVREDIGQTTKVTFHVKIEIVREDISQSIKVTFCVKIEIIREKISQTMKVTFYVKIEIVREDICSSVWIFLKIRTKSCSFITSIHKMSIFYWLTQILPYYFNPDAKCLLVGISFSNL